MVALSFVVLVGAAVITCLFMAWVLGANSNSPPFAPAIGANAISTMQAAFVIGLLAAAGAAHAGRKYLRDGRCRPHRWRDDYAACGHGGAADGGDIHGHRHLYAVSDPCGVRDDGRDGRRRPLAGR
ncbi:phosphate transporter [Natronorubrum sulfidifaciens JCM 14089]|uniref:Phosphate transporter n=1 Tax=Natronorubrum sulfidifaciens JCM 14089 TaxID=1230460 RepID=L9WDE6_9EURY|nr:phosphate transporter [Natronorubrum sulfidifaciens JCM 14089]